mmetsp:Transcript_17324/g.29870  ORF Transcript_17324/g.29870 Transcript_17324/m.29870 type:complete len:270 (+) Transcript_17324:612-1421(+)
MTGRDNSTIIQVTLSNSSRTRRTRLLLKSLIPARIVRGHIRFPRGGIVPVVQSLHNTGNEDALTGIVVLIGRKQSVILARGLFDRGEPRVVDHEQTEHFAYDIEAFGAVGGFGVLCKVVDGGQGLEEGALWKEFGDTNIAGCTDGGSNLIYHGLVECVGKLGKCKGIVCGFENGRFGGNSSLVPPVQERTLIFLLLDCVPSLKIVFSNQRSEAPGPLNSSNTGNTSASGRIWTGTNPPPIAEYLLLQRHIFLDIVRMPSFHLPEMQIEK